MLKQRIGTAVFLAAAFICVLFLPPLYQSLILMVPVTIGFWEFLGLCTLPSLLRHILTACLLFCCGILAFLYPQLHAATVIQVLGAATVLWAFIFLWILSYPKSVALWNHSVFKVLQGFLLLFAAWLGFCVLIYQEHARQHLLYVVALVACADIGAYFSGKRLGKHRLAKNVSPGKTWEGFAGGILLSVVLAIVVSQFVENLVFLPAPGFIVLSILCASISVVGDLYESMLKRQAGAKDSGHILPGHGGFLDRIDGLIAALSLYSFVLLNSEL